MKRRSVVILGSIVVAAAAIAWAYGRGDKKADVKYETVVVEKGRISARVTATGTLSALVTVQVGSQVSGRIQAILADFNSPVKKGQIVARLDSQLFDAAVEQARANLAVADANVLKARVQSMPRRMKSRARTRAGDW